MPPRLVLAEDDLLVRERAMRVHASVPHRKRGVCILAALPPAMTGSGT
jgi:hypothetical protein